VHALEGGFVLTLVLFALFAMPTLQSAANAEVSSPVAPEEVLAWQLQGLTQEEVRGEVNRRGLSECAEASLLSALSAAGADEETVRMVRNAKAPCTVWKLDLRLPRPTDYLYEVAGAVMWSNWDYARQTMEAQASKQPRDSDVRLIYAHLLSRSEDWITAYGEVTEAVALAPQWPYAHALRSTICYHSGLAECALRDANVFIKMRPEDAAAHIVLGHAKELQGHDEEALAAYGEAKRLHEGYAEIFAGFGRVYARKGDFEKAITAFAEAIRLDGEQAEYYAELAQIYGAEEHWRDAIENWKKAKELEPRPEILLALGKAYAANKQYGAAAREYQELLQMAPETEGVKEQLAKALRAEGHEAEAQAVEEQRDPL
jgi:tetratricopeptide (TPR) repeat protein